MALKSDRSDWEAPHVVEAAGGAGPAALPGLLNVDAVLHFIRRYLWLLVLALLAGAGFAVALQRYWPESYTATSLIQVRTQPSRLTPFDEGVGGIGPDAAAIASIIEIANSDTMRRAIVERNGLTTDPNFNAAGIFGTAPGLSATVAKLGNALRVQRRGLSYVIEVSVTLRDAEQAAMLANAVAGQITERQNDIRVGTAAAAAEQLRARLQNLDEAARLSSRRATDYRMQHGLGEVRADGTIGDRQQNYIAQRIAETRARLEGARARYGELRRANPLELDSAQAHGLLDQLRMDYAARRRTAAELARTLGPLHPQVRRNQEGVETARQQVAAEISRLRGVASAGIDALKQQLASLEAEFERLKAAEIATSRQRAELAELDSRAAQDKEVLDRFRRTQTVVDEQKDLGTADVVVAAPAQVPIWPNKPPLALVGPVGALTGLLAGFGIGAMLDQRALRTNHVARSAAHGPVTVASIGELPPLPPPLAGTNAATLAVVDARAALIDWVGAMRPAMDSGRGLAVGLSDIGASTGRTAVAIALTRLALEGPRAVLVISDHGLAGAPVPGLRDVVIDHAELRASTSYDSASDFTLMRSGCSSEDEYRELLAHRDFPAVVERLRKLWNVIVIEMPALPGPRPPAIGLGVLDALLLVTDPRLVRIDEVPAVVTTWPPHLRAIAGIVENRPPLVNVPISTVGRAWTD